MAKNIRRIFDNEKKKRKEWLIPRQIYFFKNDEWYVTIDRPIIRTKMRGMLFNIFTFDDIFFLSEDTSGVFIAKSNRYDGILVKLAQDLLNKEKSLSMKVINRKVERAIALDITTFWSMVRDTPTK